jgi:hypothetical protein
MSTIRKPCPSDVSDEEWSFVAPYLALLPEDVGQRKHDLREVFNGLRTQFTMFRRSISDVERFLKRFMVVLLTFRLKICSLYGSGTLLVMPTGELIWRVLPVNRPFQIFYKAWRIR